MMETVSLSRRGAMRLGAAGATAAVTTRGPSQTAAQGEPATFVLVPGAWTGAFVWRDVAALLRAAGHEVHTPTCTGLGDRVHLTSPSIDLDTHVTDIVNFMEFADLDDVVLVGHSYGGMIITGVAEQAPERLAQLVYLDADVPAAGQSSYDFAAPDPEAREAFFASEGGASLAAGMPGMLPVSLYERWLRDSIADPVVADWFIAKLVPHPLATWTQPVRRGNSAAAELPRAFILCTEGKDAATDAYLRVVEELRVDPAWRVIEMADTHMVNLNDPEGTVEVLLSLL